MSDENLIGRLLADLKQRFAQGHLTYAEAVMIEDLIAAMAEIDAKADEDTEACAAERPSDDL